MLTRLFNFNPLYCLLVCLVLIGSKVTHAQSGNLPWVEFGQLSNSDVFVRENSIERVGDYLKIWVLYNYHNVRTSPSDEAYRSAITLFQFDCQDNKSQKLNSYGYEEVMGKGRQIDLLDRHHLDDPKHRCLLRRLQLRITCAAGGPQTGLRRVVRLGHDFRGFHVLVPARLQRPVARAADGLRHAVGLRRLRDLLPGTVPHPIAQHGHQLLLQRRALRGRQRTGPAGIAHRGGLQGHRHHRPRHAAALCRRDHVCRVPFGSRGPDLRSGNPRSTLARGNPGPMTYRPRFVLIPDSIPPVQPHCSPCP